MMQDIIVYIILGVVAIYAIYLFVKACRRFSNSSACGGGCSCGCSAKEGKKDDCGGCNN